MHGTLMLTNRRGRKRKFRGSKPGAREVTVVELNPRTIAAAMPHRRAVSEDGIDALPEAVRHDQRAVSELGRMCLFGGISDDMELAGNKFLGDYGAYMATVHGPRNGAGTGRGFGCLGNPDELDASGQIISVGCPDCECARRKAKYLGAVAAVKACGTLALEALFMVAVHDRAIAFKRRAHLRWALAALVKHYGLGARRK